MNEDELQLQMDAVGIMLSYLKEERRALQEKHESWVSSSSRFAEIAK